MDVPSAESAECGRSPRKYPEEIGDLFRRELQNKKKEADLSEKNNYTTDLRGCTYGYSRS